MRKIPVHYVIVGWAHRDGSLVIDQRRIGPCPQWWGVLAGRAFDRNPRATWLCVFARLHKTSGSFGVRLHRSPSSRLRYVTLVSRVVMQATFISARLHGEVSKYAKAVNAKRPVRCTLSCRAHEYSRGDV